MSKKKLYYAIKVGNNVKNKIVETWNECKQLVIGYPSIYKGFRKEKEAKRYLKDMSSQEVEMKLKLNEIHRFQRLKEKWEKECHFEIPNYIIDEIINGKDYANLCALLCLAVSNNRISEKNANILKEKCKKLNIMK